MFLPGKLFRNAGEPFIESHHVLWQSSYRCRIRNHEARQKVTEGIAESCIERRETFRIFGDNEISPGDQRRRPPRAQERRFRHDALSTDF